MSGLITGVGEMGCAWGCCVCIGDTMGEILGVGSGAIFARFRCGLYPGRNFAIKDE
jgi:hypothetical protein